MRSKVLFSALIVIMSFAACRKDASFPIEPVLVSFEVEPVGADSALITLNFTDGDGDIGSLDIDCMPSVNPDLDFDYYELVDGEWVMPDLQPFLAQCLPDITPEGQDKLLEGTMEIMIEFPPAPDSPDSDTIKLAAQLRDRADNLSNVLESGMLIPN